MSDVIVVGSFVQDLGFRTRQFPGPGETRIGTFKMGPGGKGFNQAVACSRLDVDTTFIGATGDDAFARDLSVFLKGEKLKTKLLTVPQSETGAASIIVNDSGQNQIVVALGANNYLEPSFITQQSSVFNGAKVVVAQFESNLNATKTAFELAHKCGAKTILNPAPINDDASTELLMLTDFIVPNETEAQFLLEKFCDVRLPKPIVTHSDEELGALATKLSNRTVIITLGSDGAFVKPEKGNSFRVNIIKVKAIDTAGAGDAFSGGLAAGLVRHPNSLTEAVNFATTVAGLSTEKPGTAPAMPYIDAVLTRSGEL